LSGWSKDKANTKYIAPFQKVKADTETSPWKESQWFKSFDRPRQRAVDTHSLIRMLMKSFGVLNRICVLLLWKQSYAFLMQISKGTVIHGRWWDEKDSETLKTPSYFLCSPSCGMSEWHISLENAPIAPALKLYCRQHI